MSEFAVIQHYRTLPNVPHISDCLSASEVTARAKAVTEARRRYFTKARNVAGKQKLSFEPTISYADISIFGADDDREWFSAIRQAAEIVYRQNPVFTIIEIQNAICTAMGTTRADMISPRRDREALRPRHLAILLCRKLTVRSMPEISMKFGNRDHTTILHACKRLEHLWPMIKEKVPECSPVGVWARTAVEIHHRYVR